MVLGRMKIDRVTVHGLRSTFTGLGGECTNFPNEVCEAALTHVIENKAEAAYRRSDPFERRRPLMQQWGSFCDQQTAESLVPIRRSGRCARHNFRKRSSARQVRGCACHAIKNKAAPACRRGDLLDKRQVNGCGRLVARQHTGAGVGISNPDCRPHLMKSAAPSGTARSLF
jgi:hypothetical protein